MRIIARASSVSEEKANEKHRCFVPPSGENVFTDSGKTRVCFKSVSTRLPTSDRQSQISPEEGVSNLGRNGNMGSEFTGQRGRQGSNQ